MNSYDHSTKLGKTFPVGWLGGWVAGWVAGWVRKAGNKAQTQPAVAGAWLSLAINSV